MVLTPAGKRREPDSPGGETRAAKKSRQSNKAKTSKMALPAPALLAAKEKKKPKGLLDMPAEIRNNIYHFASERNDFEGWEKAVPLLLSHRGHGCGLSQWSFPKTDDFLSARKFLGLTQTCKILRHEFRPIWLRNSKVRVRPSDLLLYIHTFYGCRSNYTNLPNRVQISYNHDIDESVDLTHILRMRAASPTTKFEFIPHELTLGEGAWSEDSTEDCELCEEDLMNGDVTFDQLEDFGCPHEYARRYEHADWLLMDEYPYIGALNRFLAHRNPKWLEDVRGCKVTRVKLKTSGDARNYSRIKVCIDSGSDIITEELSNKNMLAVAHDYLKDRDLKHGNTFGNALDFRLHICSGCI